VLYSTASAEHRTGHEHASRKWVAEKLAALKDYEFAGEYDAKAHYDGPLHFVPNDTLVGLERARALGIHSEHDLFGGAVPSPFIATKTITHPLVGADAVRPDGWSHAFSTRVRDAVFPGYSAFTLHDARLAAERVLESGPARIKLGRGVGGFGQEVISSAAEIDGALGNVDQGDLRRHGVVIERNLEEVTTFSVGYVLVSDLVATYCGTQRVTTNRAGAEVYGGSDLIVVRGDYDALLELELAAVMRLPIEQARKYDVAASHEFPDFIASRRNYDVAYGVDGDGRPCSGVLEQSWRIGGASAAEVAALEVFRAKPDARAVRAATVELYGETEAPKQATVYFRGSDQSDGPIIKYTIVEEYGNPS
jgi:hypothetical protein